MKKVFTYVFAAVLMLSPMVVAAAGNTFGKVGTAGTTLTTVGSDSGMSSGTFGGIIQTVLNWLIGILGIGAIISFVIAGILYLIAGGDEAKTEKAKNMMTYAIIAVVVALVGYIAINLVANLVGGAANSATY